jgi:hypothetical protein
MSSPNITGGVDKTRALINKGANELLEMNDNTAITLLTFLTFFIIILSFIYYFYYNGSGTIGGISIILIVTIMTSIVGQAVMGIAGAMIGGIIGALIGITIFVKMSNSKINRNCSVMDGVYGEKNIAITNTREISNPFYDYYVKTAYNCCSGGDYRNDYVSMCSLNDLLKQGVRGLDFEIYSINDEPVVATSTVDNYCVKETFNYINFSDVLTNVLNNAFTSNAPNPNDPIIFHLRIKSENKAMYTKFAQLLQSIPTNRIMDSKYSYENKQDGHITNFGAVPLSDMMGRIIIIVDRSNPTCLCESEDCADCNNFYEFVNMTSNSTFMQVLRYNDIEFTQTPDDLINQNRAAMTIGIPNKGPNPANPSSVVMRSLGCQMLAMRYQSVDANVEENDLFFNTAGHAFVLKPPELRAQITIVAPPIEQNPALFYNDRILKSDIYELKV